MATNSSKTNGVRNSIVEAAVTCFGEYGVAKTTMEDIAQRANVSRITVHRHFRTRDALIQEVLAEKLRRFTARARKELEACDTLTDRIVRYLMLSVSVGARDKSLMALLEADGSGHAGEVVATSEALRRSVEELWGPFFEDARTRGELRAEITSEDASFWIMMMQFLLVQALHKRFRGDRLEELIRHFITPAFVTSRS
ncbi:MAG: TetR/AcrR family transcriptional regulator [Acidimicrobiia bacterium]